MALLGPRYPLPAKRASVGHVEFGPVIGTYVSSPAFSTNAVCPTAGTSAFGIFSTEQTIMPPSTAVRSSLEHATMLGPDSFLVPWEF